MINFPVSLDISPNGQPFIEEDKYKVLTLYREHDNVCVIRLSGFDSTVFWKEIKLNRWWFRSPRERIIKAQEKAERKAENLRWRDQQAKHEFEISGGKSY